MKKISFSKFKALLLLPLILGSLIVVPVIVTFFQKHTSSPYLTVVGYIKMADGLGRQSVELIKTFKDDVKVSFHRTRGDREQGFDDVEPYIIPLLTKKYKRPGKVIIFEDYEYFNEKKIHKILKRSKNRDHHILIAYTMFESTKIPIEWTGILNKHFDVIVVPDPYLVEVYQNSGVTVPIFCLPLGLYLDDYMEQPLKKHKNHPFVFANYSSFDPRKNQLGLVRAFAKAFGNQENVILKLNFRAGAPFINETILEEINRLGLSNVQVTGNALPKREYIEAFKDIDCYVNLAKGEGFSIQPREAMALGIPVIVSDNTSQQTIAKTNLVRAVASKIKEPAYFPHVDQFCGYYFNFEIDQAAEALLDVYENYEKFLSYAKEARDWVKQYEFSNLKKHYQSLIKPRKLILGDRNEIHEDYFMTNSLELYQKYQRITQH